MASLPALVVNNPSYHFWNIMDSSKRSYWIDVARDYQKQLIDCTPQAIVFIPNIAVLPHTLAPPVKEIGQILKYEDFSIKDLLTSGTTGKYWMGTNNLYLRNIPYISTNTFPILWKQPKKELARTQMIMAGIRIGDIFFITVDLPTQYKELSNYYANNATPIYQILESIHNAWMAAIDNATNMISSLELFREFLTNGIRPQTMEAIPTSFLGRVTNHMRWVNTYFNRTNNVESLERHVRKIRLNLTGRRLNRQYLDEYETIIELPHAYYAVTKPIRIDYSENTQSKRPKHRQGLAEWVRPRMPPTRYLIILPKIGFNAALTSRSITILSERKVGHPHLYGDGHACYGEVSTIFGDAYASANYTTMLIRAAHMLRTWNPNSPAMSTYDFELDKNLIVCEEKCCHCARTCDNRCRFCLYTTPDEFIACTLDSNSQLINDTYGRNFQPRATLHMKQMFECERWQNNTLSMCCADSKCPFYTEHWKESVSEPLPCRSSIPCAHCPENNCALRKNPFTNYPAARANYTKWLKKIRGRLRARYKILDADQMPSK